MVLQFPLPLHLWVHQCPQSFSACQICYVSSLCVPEHLTEPCSCNCKIYTRDFLRDNKSIHLQDIWNSRCLSISTIAIFVLMQFAVGSLSWKCGNSSWMTARFDKIFNNANFPDKGLKQNTILFVQVWILFEHVELECGWLVCKLYSLFIVC